MRGACIARGTVVAIVVLLGASWAAANTITVGTFADPKAGEISLFRIDWVDGDMTQGGIIEVNTDLGDPCMSMEFRFPGSASPQLLGMRMMDTTGNSALDLTYLGQIVPGMWVFQTEAGRIEFYDLGSGTTVFGIDFTMAYVTPDGMAMGDPIPYPAGPDAVEFDGSEIDKALPDTMEQEKFAFSFANNRWLNGDAADGEEVTASFTSSALLIPEPATALLVLVGAPLYRRWRKAA